MTMITETRCFKISLFFLLFIMYTLVVQPLLATGNYKLSKNADVSTIDRVFSRNDIMYMLVEAKDIDFTDIDKNEFSLKPQPESNADDNFTGTFKNNFDGTYTASLSLSTANPNQENWQWRARIKDESDNDFEVRVDIKIIGGGNGGEEVEFTGTIDAIDIATIVVDAMEFVVTANTEFLDNLNIAISLPELSVGQVVQIKGVRGNDGVLRAIRIKIENTDLGDNEIEVTGTLTDMSETHVKTQGLTFQVDQATQLFDEQNNPIALSDIKIGFIVEIRANVLNNETFLATKIKIADRLHDEIDIIGVIENIGEHSLLVAGFEFIVTDTTEILDSADRAIFFNDLRIENIVQITAQVHVDRTLIATHIKVENRLQGEVEVTSSIATIGSDYLLVAGIKFVVNSKTEILDPGNNPISFTDLQAGFIVEIRGMAQQDGQLAAMKIRIEERIIDEVKITGVIEQYNNAEIVILGKTFSITQNSVFFDKDENRITIAQLFVGQTVEVRGDLMTDGTLVAIRIEERETEPIEVVGPIDAFATNTIVVLGVTFFMNDTAQLLDAENNPIDFSALELGRTVTVRAVGQSNGTQEAVRIKIEDIALLSGIIERVEFNGIRMLGKQILFDSNTLILGKLNEFLSIYELSRGQFVQVRAKEGRRNVIFGTKIKIQGTVTSVNLPSQQENPERPEDFALLQNYPNPFNPSTTIAFRISGKNPGTIKTTLTIFNLLGQTVRTLVDAPLSVGSHQMQWDGKDAFGSPVGSGMYLYRLTSGTESVTRRMVLMR
ncbi:MAG: DUF5666 domain-containing protein [bacterium]